MKLFFSPLYFFQVDREDDDAEFQEQCSLNGTFDEFLMVCVGLLQ